jgi:hypothetical protein
MRAITSVPIISRYDNHVVEQSEDDLNAVLSELQSGYHVLDAMHADDMAQAEPTKDTP